MRAKDCKRITYIIVNTVKIVEVINLIASSHSADDLWNSSALLLLGKDAITLKIECASAKQFDLIINSWLREVIKIDNMWGNEENFVWFNTVRYSAHVNECK